ncbi:copia protein [Tanacetum coccineum]
MTTLAEHIIVAGAENRPPMIEKSMYDSCVEENRQTGPKKYSELTKAQQLQDDCDVQATNIILHGLPTDVYALVNHQEAAKDIWDRVKMLMKGTELLYQERECRLYNLFDKFAYVQVQVNTKFLNALPSEWSKFVTNVKLAKSLYTTNYDQLYAYLSQHANEVRITRERYMDPLALAANSPTIYNPSQSPQHSDPIECINKAMAFLSVVASRFPPSNNQLKTSSNLINQATIQDGRVTVQRVQGRQNQSYVGTGNRGIATTLKGNFAAGQPRVVKCYNCQGERHMAKQCTQPKRPRNVAWFKEKLMLAEAQEADLDAYDSDCDDLSSAKAVLMANLSSCDPEVLFESQDAVIHDTNSSAPNDLLVLSLVEQMTDHVPHLDKENQTNKMVNESLTAELERYKERVTIFKQRLNVDLNKREKLIDSQMDDLIRDRNAKLAAFQQEIDTLKETLSNNVK